MLSFSQACENNKQAILDILQRVFADRSHVLEIGSGTGQHAEYFVPRLSHLSWQCSDVAENLAGIEARLSRCRDVKHLAPICLDMNDPHWPQGFDAVFSANTLHIMPWTLGQRMIKELGRLLPLGGIFAVYGPFNYNGSYTSASNAQFDRWLKEHDDTRGIRSFEQVEACANNAGLHLLDDNAMPANNRLLVWQKKHLKVAS